MWNIAKGVLWFVDGFFDILDSIWRYKFFDNEYVNKIFSGALIVACSWLVLKVIIELIMSHMVKGDSRESPLSIYKGVVLAIVMMFLVTPLFTFGHQVSTSLTDAVISVSGMKSSSGDAESTISKALIRSMVYEDEMDAEDIDYLVENYKTIDITQSEGGAVGIGDKYTYSVNLFMLVVVSVLTLFLLFFVAIQMAKRVMEIALFKIIAPFCCTGLTSNQSKSFEIWLKSTMGLFLITVVQFVSLGLMINMFGSAITDNGTLAGIFLIVGALLFIISTPTLISTLLNQQSGMMSAFGDIQSMMALGHGVSAGLSVANSGLASAVSVVPKSAGHISRFTDNVSNYKDGGSSTLGAVGHSTFAEARRPFMSAFNKTRDNFQSQFNMAKGIVPSPNINNDEDNFNSQPNSASFGFSTSNPYSDPYSLQFNPIKNQYQNMSDSKNENGRWY